MINKDNIHYWRRSRLRWRWFGWGFRFIFLIFSILILFLWINAPDSDTANILLIIFIIFIIIDIIGFIVIYYLSTRRYPSADRTVPRERMQASRKVRAARAGFGSQMKYCIKCGKQIYIDAQFCEFCGVEQSP